MEAVKLGLQLVALDRPGMGFSTRIPNRQINDYPSQVAQLVEQLQVRAYSILGVSGGGPYALACAAHKSSLPGLHKVGVLAGLGSRDLPQSGMSVVQWLSITAMDYVPSSLFCWFWNFAIGKAARNPDEKVLMDKIRLSMRAQRGEDATHVDERVVRGMTAALRGAFAQGSEGYLDEATVVCKSWGFTLAEIRDVNVSLWYGGHDGLAPAAAGKALADAVGTTASFTLYERESHTVVTLKHREEILSFLAA